MKVFSRQACLRIVVGYVEGVTRLAVEGVTRLGSGYGKCGASECRYRHH